MDKGVSAFTREGLRRKIEELRQAAAQRLSFDKRMQGGRFAKPAVKDASKDIEALMPTEGNLVHGEYLSPDVAQALAEEAARTRRIAVPPPQRDPVTGQLITPKRNPRLSDLMTAERAAAGRAGRGRGKLSSSARKRAAGMAADAMSERIGQASPRLAESMTDDVAAQGAMEWSQTFPAISEAEQAVNATASIGSGGFLTYGALHGNPVSLGVGGLALANQIRKSVAFRSMSAVQQRRVGALIEAGRLNDALALVTATERSVNTGQPRPTPTPRPTGEGTVERVRDLRRRP
jgi:hypothetical protein